jgi:hypothetical protein
MPISRPRPPFTSAQTNRSPGLLILEGDAGKLRREGHTRLTDEIVEMLAPLVKNQALRVQRIPITSKEELDVAKAFASFSTYDAVVLLAHGSPQGLQAASGVAMPWSDLARAIAPTKPRFLLAVSCFAANSAAADALFDGIPTLERIIGSPAPLTIAQARVAILELGLAACGLEIPQELSALINVLNALDTRGVLFTRTREGRVERAVTGSNGEDMLGFVAWLLLQDGSSNDDLARTG